MNEKSSNPRDHAAELAALHGLGALDGVDAAAMADCGDCLFGKAALAALGFELTTAEITATLFPPVAPSAGLKDKIMARISPPAPPQEDAKVHYLPSAEGQWQILPGGKIRIKPLSDLPEAGHTVFLLEASPGGVLGAHFHEGMEEFYLISGDLTTNGLVLGPGDYMRHAPGTHHDQATSEHGCLALVVTARENHPRKAIGAYNELRNLMRGMLGN